MADLDLCAIEEAALEQRLLPRTTLALVAEVRRLRDENAALRDERDLWHDAAHETLAAHMKRAGWTHNEIGAAMDARLDALEADRG